jgi:nicotinamide-nucleotide amidase
MKVHILTIGDEILIGQIVDTNSAWMSRRLNLQGAQVSGKSSVGDDLEDIQEALRNALAKADAVLITGGLGPTKDDITKKALADFFGVDLVFHEATWERIQKLFEKWGRSTTPAHRQQCFMPANAQLLHNKMGTAPGMWFEHEGKVVVSMPGIPYEMEYLMQHEALPRLAAHFPGRPIAHRTILTVGEGESRIAARIEAFEEQLPPGFKLAYLPNLGKVRLRLTGVGADQEALERELDRKAGELEALIPELVFGRGEEQLEAVIGRMLRERKLTLGTAESCTGGLIAHRITTIPGSSDYFMGGVVSYSNDLKQRLLGVRIETLEQHGAVSEETVREMVAGGLELMGVDIVVAVSGIAGPGGGTPDKPVGTVWMAAGTKEGIKTEKWQIGKDRLKNIEYSAVQALNLVRRLLLEM